MAKRTNDLTEFAKPIADQLTKRTGSLKIVLSAGVIALSKLTAEEKEQMIAEANGISTAKSTKKALQEALDTIKEHVQEQGPSVRYVFPDKNDQALIDNLRRILGPEPQKKEAKKTRLK